MWEAFGSQHTLLARSVLPRKYVCVFFTLCLWKIFREEICNISFSFLPDDVEMPISYFILDPVISSIDVLSFPVVYCVVSNANCTFVVAFMVCSALRVPDAL